MVTVEKNSLTIKVAHPIPQEGLKDLQNAIINTVQTQVDVPIETMLKEHMDGAIVLLELLKSTLN